MFQRKNVLKMLSLVHHQFSSPRLYDFIKYAWFKSGYMDQRPNPFVSPINFAFDFPGDTCKVGNFRESPCDGGVFIRCLWCTKEMCFKHFFDLMHLCQDYKELE